MGEYDKHANRNRLIAITQETATKRGEPWTKDEDELLASIDSQQSELLAAAQLLNRTFSAVVVRYYKIRVAQREGRLIRYDGRRNRNNYPTHRPQRVITIYPSCACADPWDHRDWCPDRMTQAA